jgi:hypothetical protein
MRGGWAYVSVNGRVAVEYDAERGCRPDSNREGAKDKERMRGTEEARGSQAGVWVVLRTGLTTPFFRIEFQAEHCLLLSEVKILLDRLKEGPVGAMGDAGQKLALSK